MSRGSNNIINRKKKISSFVLEFEKADEPWDNNATESVYNLNRLSFGSETFVDPSMAEDSRDPHNDLNPSQQVTVN